MGPLVGAWTEMRWRGKHQSMGNSFYNLNGCYRPENDVDTSRPQAIHKSFWPEASNNFWEVGQRKYVFSGQVRIKNDHMHEETADVNSPGAVSVPQLRGFESLKVSWNNQSRLVDLPSQRLRRPL